MSRRFTLQILLPIEGYEEDKIYESEDIALTVVNLKQKPDDVYYRCLKEKSVYASFHDVVKYACEKYSLGRYITSLCILTIGAIVKLNTRAIDTLLQQKKQSSLKASCIL